MALLLLSLLACPPCPGPDEMSLRAVRMCEGGFVDVELWQRCASVPTYGWQALMYYDTANLTFDSAWHPPDSIYNFVFENMSENITGHLQGAAVQNPPCSPAGNQEDTLLCTMRFSIVADQMGWIVMDTDPSHPPTSYGDCNQPVHLLPTFIAIEGGPIDAYECPCNSMIGDYVRDGCVDDDAVFWFVQALLGTFTLPVEASDANCDGVVDGRDIGPFIGRVLR